MQLVKMKGEHLSIGSGRGDAHLHQTVRGLALEVYPEYSDSTATNIAGHICSIKSKTEIDNKERFTFVKFRAHGNS